MSTISDWLDDYTGADANEPANATDIAYPADGVSDLGFVLRDIKSVIRQESLNKGWWPDARAVTRISDDVFSCASAGRSDYPVGTAVKLIGSGGTVSGWVAGHPASDRFTIAPLGQITVGFGVTHAVFSALLPNSDPVNADASYPRGVGSALPARLTQWARFRLRGNTDTQAVLPLAKVEPDTDYRVMVQAVEVNSGPAANGAYRVESIAKTTTDITVTVGAAPGSGTTVFYEYGIFRGE